MEKTLEEFRSKFAKYLKEKHLRVTPQREKILEVFLESEGHLSMEELFLLVRQQDRSIGQVTVYRTLKLLCEAGLASALNFEEGMVRYEPMTMHHHDHLVCEKCGKKVEFMDREIEGRQKALCREFGFRLTTHHMVLYGICSDCQKEKR